MARLARAELFAPDEVAIVHVMNRVVWRCFLLGDDPVTGKNYDHRKQWIEDELRRLADAMGIDRNRPIWVCGSTGDGEEPLLLDAYRQVKEKVADLQLVIVPRKPERFDEVANGVEGAGYRCVRRSADAAGRAGHAGLDVDLEPEAG